MHALFYLSILGAVLTLGITAPTIAFGEEQPLALKLRNLREAQNGNWQTVEQEAAWLPSKTAAVICDMWDRHWCQGATARVAEMAPRMNQLISQLRDRGVLIIHCPSDTMKFYQDHPGRKIAQAAPRVDLKEIMEKCQGRAPQSEPKLPIDDSDGGCDDEPQCKHPPYPWTRQIATLEIKEGDAITDNVEAFYLMRQRGITNVLIMGVHQNMCVLGRPFAIRQMVKLGQNVALVRDMTDSMYNSRRAPFVDHFTGNDLVCWHIEKYWCPTLTSDQIIGGKPFRFAADNQPPREWKNQRVIKRSDVVSMYQGNRDIYEQYGITVLAWGGRPSRESLSDSNRVRVFGSVGMVTEFSRYYQRFPNTYEEGLCRDIDGKPVKVPWLTDHQHQGIPYWWCCTQQPQFRQYLKERVVETIKSGADGLHIDDHMGTAGGLWLGICFCDLCVKGFQTHLAALSPERLNPLGIPQPVTYDFRKAVQQWRTASEKHERKVTEHPLWPEWTIYQCHAQAAFMKELHELANQTAGRTVPMGANAGLLWPRHLSDYQTLDLFSAETDHHAEQRRFSDLPLFAYRLADAVDRPYAATASGGDWAYIKEHQLPGLVRGWIALSYAAGHCLMTPHRQWCYTPQKGTHWYQGPTEKFAPLYQFVRRYPELFDDYKTLADLGVVVPHRSFVKNSSFWTSLGNQLSASNISYRILLGGDEIVAHQITEEDHRASPALLIPNVQDLSAVDRQLLAKNSANRPVFHDVQSVRVNPAVTVEASGPIRLLPRTKPGSAVIHLLNYQYDASQDDVKPMQGAQVTLNLKALGLKGIKRGQYFEYGKEPVELKSDANRITIPEVGIWGVVKIEE